MKVFCCKNQQSYGGGLILVAANTMYGIHYDDTADILFDIHQCIRHQLWEDRPESEKSHITVDAYPQMRAGSEPLAIIQKLM